MPLSKTLWTASKRVRWEQTRKQGLNSAKMNLEEDSELQMRTTAPSTPRLQPCVALSKESRPFITRKCKIVNGCCFKLLNLWHLLCINKELIQTLLAYRRGCFYPGNKRRDKQPWRKKKKSYTFYDFSLTMTRDFVQLLLESQYLFCNTFFQHISILKIVHNETGLLYFQF